MKKKIIGFVVSLLLALISSPLHALEACNSLKMDVRQKSSGMTKDWITHQSKESLVQRKRSRDKKNGRLG